MQDLAISQTAEVHLCRLGNGEGMATAVAAACYKVRHPALVAGSPFTRKKKPCYMY
jgi:hypothetical protein